MILVNYVINKNDIRGAGGAGIEGGSLGAEANALKKVLKQIEQKCLDLKLNIK